MDPEGYIYQSKLDWKWKLSESIPDAGNVSTLRVNRNDIKRTIRTGLVAVLLKSSVHLWRWMKCSSWFSPLLSCLTGTWSFERRIRLTSGCRAVTEDRWWWAEGLGPRWLLEEWQNWASPAGLQLFLIKHSLHLKACEWRSLKCHHEHMSHESEKVINHRNTTMFIKMFHESSVWTVECFEVVYFLLIFNLTFSILEMAEMVVIFIFVLVNTNSQNDIAESICCLATSKPHPLSLCFSLTLHFISSSLSFCLSLSFSHEYLHIYSQWLHTFSVTGLKRQKWD